MYDDNAPHTEEDIKHLYITPAIERGWPASHIRMEARITDGRFNLRGNLVARERPKKADYLLCRSAHPDDVSVRDSRLFLNEMRDLLNRAESALNNIEGEEL